MLLAWVYTKSGALRCLSQPNASVVEATKEMYLSARLDSRYSEVDMETGDGGSTEDIQLYFRAIQSTVFSSNWSMKASSKIRAFTPA